MDTSGVNENEIRDGNKRSFSKVPNTKVFGKEKSNKRFAGNIQQNDMDFEEENSTPENK